MGQDTVAKKFSLTALGRHRIAQSRNWPPPILFLKNLGKHFWGWRPPPQGGPWGKILGVAPEFVGALTSGRRAVQNKTGSIPPTQSVWAQRRFWDAVWKWNVFVIIFIHCKYLLLEASELHRSVGLILHHFGVLQ